MEENGIRINKFLSEAGVCSRREADRQVELGNITIDVKSCENRRKSIARTVGFVSGKESFKRRGNDLNCVPQTGWHCLYRRKARKKQCDRLY
mgnify:CR=1 FL=1